MRLGLWGLGALILGAFAAHFLLQDRGYVLINFRGYAIEMSVPILVLMLGIVYFAVRALLTVWRAPRRLGEAMSARRVRRAGSKLTRGLIEMTEGDWARGERSLTQGIRGTDAPLVNYLLAARAAQLQGSKDRRNEWLKLAYEELPEAETAILLTQAELQFEEGDFERTVATLRKFGERHPNHPVALGLLAQSYAALGARRELADLLPQLGKARLPEPLREKLIAGILEDQLQAGTLDRDMLKRHWSSLPAALRQAPGLLRVHARALDRLGAGTQAESELRAALKRQWHPLLVRAYGELDNADAHKQLKQAENWLVTHPEDGNLLLTAARLCVANELWGKARSYLESGLALAPDAASFALYGQLLGRLGEAGAATEAYRRGLALASGVDTDLPALSAPISTTGLADALPPSRRGEADDAGESAVDSPGHAGAVTAGGRSAEEPR